MVTRDAARRVYSCFNHLTFRNTSNPSTDSSIQHKGAKKHSTVWHLNTMSLHSTQVKLACLLKAASNCQPQQEHVLQHDALLATAPLNHKTKQTGRSGVQLDLVHLANLESAKAGMQVVLWPAETAVGRSCTSTQILLCMIANKKDAISVHRWHILHLPPTHVHLEHQVKLQQMLANNTLALLANHQAASPHQAGAAATAKAPVLSSHVKSIRQAGVVTQEARYLQQQQQQQQQQRLFQLKHGTANSSMADTAAVA
jgi:hypothetical protein